MAKNIVFTAIVALISCPLLATAHAEPPLYTITDLGTFGGTNSIGTGINASGQVTGDATFPGDTVHHAFIHSNGSLRDLGALGAATNSSVGSGINDSGDVAGSSVIGHDQNGNAIFHAFLYHNGVMHDLGTNGGIDSGAEAINNHDQVTGSYIDTTSHVFIYSKGAIQDIGAIGTGFGINDSGEITGGYVDLIPCAPPLPLPCLALNRAFLYRNGVVQDLGTLGGDGSGGAAINALGEITGTSSLTPNGFNHAFLCRDGVMYDLGTLGENLSEGYGINDKGEVVGLIGANEGNTQAFVYDDGTMYDLNKLIAPTDPLASTVKFVQGLAINNTGQIAASGCYTSGALNSECHAFRLDPVPVFAGTPGKANCHGQSVSALAKQYGGVNNAAAALGFDSVSALQNAIMAFCEG